MDKARKNGSIVLYNQKNTEMARYNFVAAWPSKITGPQLNANNNDIAVEEITLCPRGVCIESRSSKQHMAAST